MSVEKKLFGKLADGRECFLYTLSNGILEAKIINYGAAVQSLYFGGKDVVLGYDSIEGYMEDSSYQGAVVGRVANRIYPAVFKLKGINYELSSNLSGGGQLHGGIEGFSKKLWSEKKLDRERTALELSLISPDGEEGFPGELTVTVCYRLSGHSLIIEYSAVSDRDTVVSLTNHSYFNLNGADGGGILDDTLYVNSGCYTPLNEKLVPDGRIKSVKDSPYDFTQPKRLGDAVLSDDPEIRNTGGLDINFVLGTERGLRHAATLRGASSGIVMDCMTDLPGLQIYTSNFLDEPSGKYGVPLCTHQGIALETQFFPNSVNTNGFPSVKLAAGRRYYSLTEFIFRMS